MFLQILIWWLVSTLLGLAALPLTTYLFRSLPDRGYPFARAFGLLLVGYLAWLLAMIGLAPFNRGTLIVCAIGVLAVGIVANRRPAASDKQRAARNLFNMLPRWRIASYELIFLAALVFMALLRSRGPDPWGTERPMDFALFNAIQRSTSFPPHDPWLAGFSINYYYLGYLLMASMALLSGLQPSVAFNLSLALIYALTAVGIAGVVMNLIGLSLPHQGSKHETTSAPLVRPARWRGFAAPAFALLAIVFVLFAGNQGGALAIISGTPRVLYLAGGDMLRAVQNGFGPRQPLTLNTPVQEWGGPVDENRKPIPTTQITPSDTVENFDTWWPSRALWDRAPNPADRTTYYAITEFPMFSFLLGDMHPHVMALPFGLLAFALALATFARPVAPVFALTWRGWLELVLTGIVLGSLYMINSWDFPTYLLLYLAALALLYLRLGQGSGFSEAESRMPRSRPTIIWPQLVQHALLVVVAAFVLFAPFFLTFKSQVGNKEPLIALPLLGSLTSIVGFVNWTKTPLHSFVIMFGLFLLPLAGLIFGVGQRVRLVATSETREQMPSVPPIGALGILAQPAPPPALLPMLPWVVLAALILGVVFGFPLLFLLPLGVYAVLLAVRTVENPGLSFALLAAALGAFICFGTELIYIRDVFEGGASRMNTIFKFYYQVWLIWGVLAAYAVWWIIDGRRTTVDERPNRPLSLARRLPSVVLLALTAAFLLGALSYPYFGVFSKLREQPALGLAGKTPRQQTAAGAASIEWLRANTTGREVILEANGGQRESYDPSGQGIGGVSASSGLATVLGWPGHENQWRAGDPAALAQIEPRRADVETIYTTTDLGQARALLAQYDVNFVYVGQAERQRFSIESLDKFAQLGTPVFQQGEVVIYSIGT